MSYKKSVLFFITLALVSASSGFAQEKTATVADDKGSGKAVVSEKDGKKTLRLSDILDETVCRWRNTDGLLKEFKLKGKVDEILGNLKKIHPYMAYLIRREMDLQQWCLTTNLKFAVSDDADQVTESYVPQLQIAIREITPKKVYLDVPKFLQLPEDDRASTLIHETTHSFLDKASAERNSELRAIVRKIYDYYVDSKSKDSLFTPAEQVANMDATLKATNSVNVFKFVEFGQAFGQAVNDPAKLTDDQWKLLIGFTDPTTATQVSAKGLVLPTRDQMFNTIINEVGQAKFAGGLMSHRVEFLGMKFFTQVDTLRSKIATAPDDETKKDLNLDPFADAFQTNIGACEITKAATSFNIEHGGFLSVAGYAADFNQQIAIRNRDGSKLRVKYGFPLEWTRNHSLLIFISLTKLSTISEPYIKEWEGKLQKAADYLSSGACNDGSATGRKYL